MYHYCILIFINSPLCHLIHKIQYYNTETKSYINLFYVNRQNISLQLNWRNLRTYLATKKSYQPWDDKGKLPESFLNKNWRAGKYNKGTTLFKILLKIALSTAIINKKRRSQVWCWQRWAFSKGSKLYLYYRFHQICLNQEDSPGQNLNPRLRRRRLNLRSLPLTGCRDADCGTSCTLSSQRSK